MLYLYNNLSGLPFWDEESIDYRNMCISYIKQAVSNQLETINSAWRFKRVEGPLLTPREFISSSYTSDDIFEIAQLKQVESDNVVQTVELPFNERALRAETTASSYAYAQYLLKPEHGFKIRPPLCVWQSGKSFRQERSDGATAAKLRFNEFYQLEFQCIFSVDTKVDYAVPIYKKMEKVLRNLTNSDKSRIINSDRLPSYSELTVDIEVPHNNSWREVASISLRTDFPMPNMKVLEIAIGLDRLVAIHKINTE